MKEYGFDILTKKGLENDSENSFQSAEPTTYHTLPYTRDASILQAILDYSIDKGTENFTRDKITTEHLFSKRDKNNKLSSKYEVFNKKYVGTKKKLKMM